MGIAPEYFLDEMSFDEIAELLKVKNDQEKRELEKERLSWFHVYRAMGSDVQSPEKVQRFEWEKKEKRQGKKFTEEENRIKAEKAKKYYGKQRL